MSSGDRDLTPAGWRERLTGVWFPLLAVTATVAAFVGGLLLAGPHRSPAPETANPPRASSASRPSVPAAPQDRAFERHYTEATVIGGDNSAYTFRRSLLDVATGPADDIHALGDNEVRVFDRGGGMLRAWKAPDRATCLTVAGDGRVVVGAAGRVDIYDAGGNRLGGFAAGEADRPADITAAKVHRDEILVADASARIIRRYNVSGRLLGVIGRRLETGSFMLPNQSLDLDVDADGVVYATDTGRHRVTSWSLDGSLVGAFGRFGMERPEDFVGCCNPVNVALAPDGTIVTAEKMVARVKVYRRDGTLLALIGPEHFDPNNVHIFLAVDSTGRILAADPERRVILIFEAGTTPAADQPGGEETTRQTPEGTGLA